MITFQQARAIVEANRAPKYTAEANFRVQTYGYDAGDRWVVVGISDAIDDAPMTTVHKTTGEYVETYGIPNIDYEWPRGMPVVGSLPPL